MTRVRTALAVALAALSFTTLPVTEHAVLGKVIGIDVAAGQVTVATEAGPLTVPASKDELRALDIGDVVALHLTPDELGQERA